MRLPRLVGYHRDLLQSFFGRLGFLNTGCFGKLGRAGLNTLKERQCSQDTALTDELSRSFEEIRSLLALKPERELPLQPIHQQRYLAASDEPRQGSAGLLFVGPRCRRQTCRHPTWPCRRSRQNEALQPAACRIVIQGRVEAVHEQALDLFLGTRVKWRSSAKVRMPSSMILSLMRESKLATLLQLYRPT